MFSLFVDGIIFQKEAHGGIARQFHEILPRMCELDPELKITLFIDGPLKQELPSHRNIQVLKALPIKYTLRINGPLRPVLYPIRRVGSVVWNKLRGYWIRKVSKAIWHSTYYTMPDAWGGLKVVTIFDMVHELFLDLYSDPLDKIARSQKKRYVEQADAIICISETTRRDVERIFGALPGKITTIFPAPSSVFHVLNSNEKDFVNCVEQPYMLFVGNRSHHKNFHGLINVYRQWDYYREVPLVVVGAPWTLKEKSLINELNLSNHIKLLIDVDDERLCRLYNRAAAFIYPSLYEGFGIPLLEAMACGCPVIASRIPSTEEVAEEVPYYFELDHPNSLLLSMDQVLNQEKDQKRIDLGLQRASQFSWDNTAKETLEIYRTLRESKP